MAHSNRPDRLEDPTPESLREEFTPKQVENWEEHGKPVYEALEDDAARKWYLRLRRPKKRGDGMMDRDHVKTGTPEKYLRESMDHFERPRQSFHGMVMATLGVTDDEQRDELDEAAVHITAAKVEAGIHSRAAARRIVENNERVAAIYGASA